MPPLVQIYEVTSPPEASALAELGVDHIGVLVGKGIFPREQSAVFPCRKSYSETSEGAIGEKAEA